MSDEPILRVRSRSSSGSGRALQLPILILSAGLWLLALAEIFQGWEMVRLAGAYETPARIGDLVSATLANGQVFFGTLDGASRTTIHLRDVFFAQLPPQAAHSQDQEAEQRTPNIIRRKDKTSGLIPTKWRSRSTASPIWKRWVRTRASPASLPRPGPSHP